MPVGDVAAEIAVVVAAVAAVLVASCVSHARQSVCAGLALLGLAAAAALTAARLDEPARLTFSAVHALDGASGAAALLVLGAAAVTVALSPEWMRTDPRHGEYYGVLLLGTLGAMLMAAAADTLQLVVAVLLSSVAGYTLAAYHRASARSTEAGMKFFLVGALANAMLLVGVVLLFGLLGTTTYQGALPVPVAVDGAYGLRVALALVVAGLAFKLGAFPAHAWMPDVAEGAPAPAAAFLTVVPKIGAAIALARLLVLFPDDTALRALVAALAVVTMTLGNLAALGQTDLRRLLGWSSVSQSGYALAGVAVVGLSDQALPALLFFLAAYAVANLAAFASVTALRGRTRLDDLAGLGTARPLAAGVLAASLLSLVGIPPLAGFVGKLLPMLAAIDAGFAWLAVAMAANTVLSLFYYLRAVAPMVFEAPRGPVAMLGPRAVAAMLVAGALVAALGVGAEGLILSVGAVSLLP